MAFACQHGYAHVTGNKHKSWVRQAFTKDKSEPKTKQEEKSAKPTNTETTNTKQDTQKTETEKVKPEQDKNKNELNYIDKEVDALITSGDFMYISEKEGMSWDELGSEKQSYFTNTFQDIHDNHSNGELITAKSVADIHRELKRRGVKVLGKELIGQDFNSLDNIYECVGVIQSSDPSQWGKIAELSTYGYQDPNDIVIKSPRVFIYGKNGTVE